MWRRYYQTYKNQIRLGLLMTLGALILFTVLYVNFLVNTNTPGPLGLALLEIEIGSKQRAFEGEVIPGMTVLNAVEAAALAGNIPFEYKIDSNTDVLIIDMLDGYSDAKTSKNLSFYLNNEKIDSRRLHLIPIGPGDVVFVRME